MVDSAEPEIPEETDSDLDDRMSSRALREQIADLKREKKNLSRELTQVKEVVEGFAEPAAAIFPDA